MIDKIKRCKWWLLFVILILMGVGAYCFLSEETASEKMTYDAFYLKVKERQVESATISEETVTFYLKDDSQLYHTDNPQNNQFKEFLLMNGVDVEEEASVLTWVYYIFDIFTSLLIIGMVIGGGVFLYKKFYGDFKVSKKTNITFDDIIGMEDVKHDFRLLLDVIKHPEKYKQTGMRKPKGILLVGPPGNGKTLFARALANEAKVPFIATKATDFQSMYMSIGPAKIKRLFRVARKKKNCIIFIDEFDGVGEKRNYEGQAIDKENNRIVTSLLNELDGFSSEESGVLVLAATNHAEHLDPALIRAGRFDRKYVIKNPDADTRRGLIEFYKKEKELTVPMEEVVSLTTGFSCSKIETLMNEASIAAYQKGINTIGREELLEAVKRC